MSTPSDLHLPMSTKVRKRKSATATRTQPKPAPEERWWFPGGSITRIGEGAFRWYSSGKWPDEYFTTVLTDTLDLVDGVGIMRNDGIEESVVDTDPGLDWQKKLEPFPYAHIFFDMGLDFPESEIGPWFCMHGIYRYSREELEAECASPL